jgi:predicted Zn-dependent protease
MRSTLLVVIPLSFMLAFPALNARSQQGTATSAAVPAWLASLTPEQRALFDDAHKSFSANDFNSALPKLRQLHEQVLQNDIITKFTAEAAVNTGDYEVATSLLDALLHRSPDDPQVLGNRRICMGSNTMFSSATLCSITYKIFTTEESLPRQL